MQPVELTEVEKVVLEQALSERREARSMLERSQALYSITSKNFDRLLTLVRSFREIEEEVFYEKGKLYPVVDQ